VVCSIFYNPAALCRWKTGLPEYEIKVRDAKKKIPIRERYPQHKDKDILLIIIIS
jgi:hypothetical protein